jgi:hypothetical protein
VVADTCNPNIQEVVEEAGRLKVRDQAGLHREILSQKEKENKQTHEQKMLLQPSSFSSN